MAVKKIVVALMSLVPHIHAGAQAPLELNSINASSTPKTPLASLEYVLLDHFNPQSEQIQPPADTQIGIELTPVELMDAQSEGSQETGMRLAGFKDGAKNQRRRGSHDSSTLVDEPNAPVLAVSGLAVVAMMVRRRKQT